MDKILTLSFLLLAGIPPGAYAGSSGPAPNGWPWPERHRDLIGSWLDAFNALDLIPGPPFLLLFIVYTAIVIVLLKVLQRLLLDLLEPAPLLTGSGQLPFEPSSEPGG
jgi:hypothetical protein